MILGSESLWAATVRFRAQHASVGVAKSFKVNLVGWGCWLTPAWAVQAVERDFLTRAFATVKDLELQRIAVIKDVIAAFAEAYRCF